MNDFTVKKGGFTLTCKNDDIILTGDKIGRRYLGCFVSGNYHKTGLCRETHMQRLPVKAYGFNYELIKRIPDGKYIQVEDDYDTYRIPAGFVKKHSQYMHFKKQGFELQLFVPIKYFDTLYSTGDIKKAGKHNNFKPKVIKKELQLNFEGVS